MRYENIKNLYNNIMLKIIILDNSLLDKNALEEKFLEMNNEKNKF